MKFKKLVSIIIALALFASLAGCAKQTGKAETTQLGRITAIDGTGVTLALGEWTASDAQEPPQKPDGDTAQDTQDGTAPTPPSDASNGEAASTAPGNNASDATAPDSGGMVWPHPTARATLSLRRTAAAARTPRTPSSQSRKDAHGK